jgi:hypothetical protein
MSREHLSEAALARAAVEADSALDNGHLAQCAPCRERLEALQAGLQALGSRARQSTPATTSSFVWPKTAQTSRAGRAGPFAWLRSPAAGAMALALLLAVAWLGFKGDQPSTQNLELAQAEAISEMLEPEPERLTGFSGFLLAENQANLDQDFYSYLSGDKDNGANGEGEMPWLGVL